MKNVPHVLQPKTCSERGHWLKLGASEQGPLVPILSEARSDMAHLGHTALHKVTLILVEH